MKLKPKDVLTALDDLDLFGQLKRRYFRDWANAIDVHVNGDGELRQGQQWRVIYAKLRVLEDLRGELKKLCNAEGVDNGKRRT